MLLPTTLQELRVRTDHGAGRIGPVPRLALPTFMATMETFGRLHPEYDLAPLSERTPRYVGSLIIAHKQNTPHLLHSARKEYSQYYDSYCEDAPRTVSDSQRLFARHSAAVDRLTAVSSATVYPSHRGMRTHGGHV